MFEYASGIKKPARRGTLAAAASAALLHVVLVGLILWMGHSGVLMALEPTGTGPVLAFPEGGGGGGGGSAGTELVTYVDIAPPAPVVEPEPVPEVVEDVLVPPEPTPVPTPPQPAPPAEAQPRPPAPTPPVSAGTGGGTGAGQGPGEGPGQGPGVGPGSGGGSGGGTGGGIGSGVGPGTGGGTSRIRPPATDLLLIPPDKPRGVASQEVTIRFRVDVRGRVREARLLTSTGNRGYDERIRRWGMELQFRPAISLDTNRPVEAETEITISV